jgi:hypothetical protein
MRDAEAWHLKRLPERSPYLFGGLIALTGTSFWMTYVLLTGPSPYNDTPSYLDLAARLGRFDLISSPRTPGYPLFVLAVGNVGTSLGLEPLVSVVVAQVLLSGLSGILLFEVGYRLTGRLMVAACAEALFFADADLQSFTGAILSDSIAVSIVTLTGWLWVRDRNWGRAAWALGVLPIVRPIFLPMPVLFGALEGLRVRRPGATLKPLIPTVVFAVVWGGIAVGAGTNPLLPVTYFSELHAFGKAYEFNLWRCLPDGAERNYLADARARDTSVYEVADKMPTQFGEHALKAATAQIVRKCPLRYVMACLRPLPRAFRQATLWRPRHDSTRIFAAVVAWHAVYWGILYRSILALAMFGVLIAIALINGYGFANLTVAYRRIFVPFMIALFAIIVAGSLGSETISRLSLPFRPWYHIMVAAGAVRTRQLITAHRRLRVATA